MDYTTILWTMVILGSIVATVLAIMLLRRP
jgi:hypothetical protein